MDLIDAGDFTVAALVESGLLYEVQIIVAIIDSGYTEYAHDELVRGKA